MNTAIKPQEETFTINGDVFTKEPDQDFLEVSIYLNKEKQLRVTVEWSKFFKHWSVYLRGEKFLWVGDLKTPMHCNPADVPTYLTDEQEAGLYRILDEVLSKNW